MNESGLRERLRLAQQTETALTNECVELAARLHDIRAAFGDPFAYSHPRDEAEGMRNFTGASSHDVVLPTLLALRRVKEEIQRLKSELLYSA